MIPGSLLRHLAARQAGTLARFACLAWGLLVAAGVLLQLAHGLAPGLVLQPWRLGAMAALALPTALAGTAPLSLAHELLRLHESGEGQAVGTAGVAPWIAHMARFAALSPLLLVLWVFVHQTRPAARAALADRTTEGALRSARLLLGAARDRGVALVRVEGAWHALLEVGGTALAVATDELLSPRPGEIRLVRGEAQFLEEAVAASRLTFDAASLALPGWRRSLAERTEKELSSAFLMQRAERWQRARLSRPAGLAAGAKSFEPARDRDLVAAALRRRALAVPSLLASWLGVLALLGRWMPRPAIVYGLVGLPASVLALYLPRLL